MPLLDIGGRAIFFLRKDAWKSGWMRDLCGTSTLYINGINLWINMNDLKNVMDNCCDKWTKHLPQTLYPLDVDQTPFSCVINTRFIVHTMSETLSPFPYDIYHTRFLGLVLVRPYRHFFIMRLITSIRFWVFYEYRKLKSTVRSSWSTWIGHSHGLSSCRVKNWCGKKHVDHQEFGM